MIQMYGKTFYSTKKVAGSVFDQGGTADGYYQTDKQGVMRFYLLSGDPVYAGNYKLVKILKAGGHLHVLLNLWSRYELRTLKYAQDGQYITLWDVVTKYSSKTLAYRHFRDLVKNANEGKGN